MFKISNLVDAKIIMRQYGLAEHKIQKVKKNSPKKFPLIEMFVHFFSDIN